MCNLCVCGCLRGARARHVCVAAKGGTGTVAMAAKGGTMALFALLAHRDKGQRWMLWAVVDITLPSCMIMIMI